MNSVSKMNLKTRALIATTGILLMMLGVNIYINMYFAMATYREALLARTTTLAEVIKTSTRRWISASLYRGWPASERS